MAARVTQTVKVLLVGQPSNARVTQVVKVVIATVNPSSLPQGLRTLGMGS